MELFDFDHNDNRKSSKNRFGEHFEPPDGGWGYLVCAGAGITFMLGFGSCSAFGILFNDFFADRGGGSGLTLVIGAYFGALSISGFITGFALNRFTLRQVGLCGALLFVLGDFLTIFATQTYHLVLTFGFIRGAGFGVLNPVSYTAINTYFSSKRSSMMSASQTLSSIASMVFPYFITFCLRQYGFRGTLILLSGIDLHMILAMMVMHPVEAHLVPNAVKLIPSEKADEVTYIVAENLVFIEEQESKNHLYSPLPQDEDANDKVKTKCSRFGKYFDLDLLVDPGYWILIIGVGFAFISDVTYLALEPVLLFSYGFESLDVAFCVMIGAGTDLASRFLMAIYSSFIVINHRLAYFLGAVLTVILRTVFLQRSDVLYVAIMTGVLGLVRCFVQVLFPLVIGDYVPVERFASAFSIYILFSGILLMSAQPFIGLIYEWSKSYVLCFHALSVCSSVCVVVWSIEFLYKKKCKCRTAQGTF